MAKKTLTLDEVYGVLDGAIEDAGSRRAFAGLHNITPAYLNEVANRDKPPGPAILDALGLEKIVSYEFAHD